MKGRYYKFSDYLKSCFGQRVQKVTVDAGFSCPNRDGKKSFDGCIYCNNEGFSLGRRGPKSDIYSQIKEGIDSLRAAKKANKFIVYFQAYTNTYDRVEVLRSRYDIIKQFKDVVGIAIATRPDCISREKLDLIDSYTKDYDVWMEYGLQSMHGRTLESINRGHDYKDFLTAFKQTRQKKRIKICVHLIIGLPYETEAMILETAREMARLKPDGVKLHPLHVVSNTKLQELFFNGEYKPLTLPTYSKVVVKFLELLSPDTVIQRITADCPRDLLVEPKWLLNKDLVIKAIEDRLVKQDTCQGRFYKD